MAPGMIIFIQAAGYYQVISKPSDTQAVVKNLGYAGNIDGTGIEMFTDLSLVVPAGLIGAAGATPGDALLAANNLSDLADPAIGGDAWTNLHLGSVAQYPAGIQDGKVALNDGDLTDGEALFATVDGIETKAKADARTALEAAGSGLATASGLTISGPGKVLGRTTAGVDQPVEELACTTIGQALMAAASAEAARTVIGALGKFGLLGKLTAADMNVVTDQAITMASTKYVVQAILVANASISLTTASGGVYNAAGKPGGGVIVDAAQAYAALTSSAKFLELTLAGVGLTDVQTAGFLYLSLSVAQGAAATADVYVFGYDLA